eukprot:CAMPEP_0116861094 /NCGR_PEP_ID=MMETSP0418-20121206/22828_1 /TAXON_ID=1158023 /ORGANISM="Astrosyne radiata, Strain 13vi08-1A" /LENGTH=32 /DNA_ID= /DNA_START= /DNA_END= /DNA_ORIENTATION=
MHPKAMQLPPQQLGPVVNVKQVRYPVLSMEMP